MIEIRHKETGAILRRVQSDTLAGARLRCLKLRGANMAGADLRGADLFHTDLSHANLEGAMLVGAHAREPHPGYRWLDYSAFGFFFSSMIIGRTVWERAPDWRSALVGYLAALPTIFISTAIWWLAQAARRKQPAHGSTARLCNAHLRRADLTGADLTLANLEAVHLQGATLIDARLGGALLRGADLRAASLCGACLRDADLEGADLRGADLRAELAGAKLTGARYDETTRWPMSFQPVRHGAVAAGEVMPAPLPQGRGDEPSPSSLPSAGLGGKTANGPPT